VKIALNIVLSLGAYVIAILVATAVSELAAGRRLPFLVFLISAALTVPALILIWRPRR